MDYHRIYREFIADRKARETSRVGYVERHHIRPRAIGGSDRPDNLVRLTPEDHFFAHLLLAKIHGGWAWQAVVRMRWGRLGGERDWIKGRYMYGVARRRQADAMSKRWKGTPGRRGADNGRHDPEQFSWVNLDTGATLFASKWEMWDRFGGCRAHWTSAATGDRKSMLGWTARPDGVRIRGHKGKSFNFVNRDGRTFMGTQGEFAAAHGVNLATASRIIRHDSVTRCGWRRKGVSDRPHNYAKDGLPGRQNRIAPSAT